jgi:hypothetical protein
VEDFSYAYCAFGAFDFAEAAAWALLFLYVNLYFQVVLIRIGWEFLVGDLLSVGCE